MYDFGMTPSYKIDLRAMLWLLSRGDRDILILTFLVHPCWWKLADSVQ